MYVFGNERFGYGSFKESIKRAYTGGLIVLTFILESALGTIIFYIL